jgi:DNA topoisomerase-1
MAVRKAKLIPFPTDPLESAAIAGLRYVRAEGPGIGRVRTGKNTFRYVSADGKPVTDEATLNRIRSLVIPPAWEDVWICPSANGHLQAVGRDARGRKQYRYHPEYRHVRDQTKYGRMLAFGAALEKIRTRVEEDLKLQGLPKNKVLATVVKLLDTTCMRIGNEEYARENKSYGLTTLKDKHVDVSGTKLTFKFRGKSGQEQNIELSDPKLAKIVKRCRDIPGYELFQYLDDEGNRCKIDSSDVNNYLREITGEEFTAKDFRTWGGTGFAALALEELGTADSETQAKKNLVAAVKAVSEKLGNRPATCRKYYVHPAILDAYMDGTLFQELQQCSGDRREETCVKNVVARYIQLLSSGRPMVQQPARRGA